MKRPWLGQDIECKCTDIICENCWYTLMRMTRNLKGRVERLNNVERNIRATKQKMQEIKEHIRRLKQHMQGLEYPPRVTIEDLINNPDHPYYYYMWRKFSMYKAKFYLDYPSKYYYAIFHRLFVHLIHPIKLWILNIYDVSVPLVSVNNLRLKELIARSIGRKVFICYEPEADKSIKFYDSDSLSMEFKSWSQLSNLPITLRSLAIFYKAEIQGGER